MFESSCFLEDIITTSPAGGIDRWHIKLLFIRQTSLILLPYWYLHMPDERIITLIPLLSGCGRARWLDLRVAVYPTSCPRFDSWCPGRCQLCSGPHIKSPQISTIWKAKISPIWWFNLFTNHSGTVTRILRGLGNSIKICIFLPRSCILFTNLAWKSGESKYL